jgi:cobalt-zinc-cadmium efflux system outer membrane protein
MRRFFFFLLIMLTGCHTCPVDTVPDLDTHVAAVASMPATPDIVPASVTTGEQPWTGPVDLTALWNLALANNPGLRETAADLEVARGKAIQAGKYPNPRILYEQEELGERRNSSGAVRLEMTQEIVTGGKRRLNIALAEAATDEASLALLGKKFDILTRIRRAYAEFLGWDHAVQVNQELVDALQKGVDTTGKLVKAGTQPRRDLVRLEALLEETKINLARSRINRAGAWKQLAAEVGVPALPTPEKIKPPPEPSAPWESENVTRRVLAANTELKQAAVEVERARLEVERARAEAVPNVQVGGGYSRNFVEQEAGAVISVETALPLWDRKQGLIHQARAHLAKAQAAQATIANRLARDAAEAWSRYQGAYQQVERLTKEVLPRLQESLELVQLGFQRGAAQLSFAEVLLAQESLEDARLKLVEARRELWKAIADLQGLMQLDLGEDLGK